MPETPPGENFEWEVDWGISGLVGTLGVRLLDPPEGTVVQVRSTVSIVESPGGSGVYVATRTAPLEQGEYQLVMDDGEVSPSHVVTEGLRVTSTGSVLVSNPPAPPYSAAQVRDRSALLTQKFPEDDPYDAATDDLNEPVTVAQAIVGDLTGRSLLEDQPGEPVPVYLLPVAVKAVTLMVERAMIAGSVQEAESAGRGRRLRGFSAGPYSEQYFAPGDLAVKNGIPTIDTNPELNAALWALATEDKRDEWLALATGVQPPVGVVSEFDFRRQGGGYFGTRPPSGFVGGPDGY